MRKDVVDALESAAFGDTQSTFKATFRFDPLLPVFKGHFPGRPILPGILQIEMVRIALEAVSKARYSIIKVHKAKFSGISLPGQEIQVNAKITADGEHTRVDAILRVEQTVKADIAVTLKINNRQ